MKGGSGDEKNIGRRETVIEVCVEHVEERLPGRKDGSLRYPCGAGGIHNDMRILPFDRSIRLRLLVRLALNRLFVTERPRGNGLFTPSRTLPPRGGGPG